MKNSKWIATSLLILAATVCSAQAQTGSVIAIRAGRLLDSKTGKVLDNQVILVKDDKIAAVGPSDTMQIPVDAQVLDLSKATVLPGLIDGHTHVFGFGLEGIKPGGPPFASRITAPPEYPRL